jgi:hypothetical protein
VTGKIVLREFAAEDAVWLDAWLPSVAEVVGYQAASSDALQERLRTEGTLRARVIARGTQPVGLVVYRLRAPNRTSAQFDLVAVPALHARNGAGMVACALAEEEMAATGARTLYAPAAGKHGISMYFWIRLGFAPLMRPQWPCEREDVAWLRRDLAPRR